MSASSEALREGLLGPLGELGVDVEDVEVQKAGRRHVVRIVVDRDGGVDLDLVASVSQRASELLDSGPLAEEVPGPFVLEVTSPGIDRPLTEARHWRRARRRLVHVVLTDGTSLDGRIVDVPSEDEVVVATDDGTRTLARTDVGSAVVQVEFNRKDDDADEPTGDEPADAPHEEQG